MLAYFGEGWAEGMLRQIISSASKAYIQMYRIQSDRDLLCVLHIGIVHMHGVEHHLSVILGQACRVLGMYRVHVPVC